VRLADRRFAERDREHPIAKRQPAPLSFDVDNDITVRKRAFDRLLDLVGRGGPRDDGLPRRDGNDDVCEIPPAGLAQPQPFQLDLGA
jgi:hypothetical protein